jgi:predicted amidohydrolase YtcJ
MTSGAGRGRNRDPEGRPVQTLILEKGLIRTMDGRVPTRVAAATADADSGAWLRGRGWRSGDWQPPREPTRHDLDPVTGDLPVALMAQDGHSLWLNSAALARADGDLARAGGIVELAEEGEPSGVLREQAAWHFRDTYAAAAIEEYVDAMRDGVPIAHARGLTAIHDKDGWIGACTCSSGFATRAR